MNKKGFQAWLLAAVFLMVPTVVMAERVDEQPSGFTMAGDLLVARPIGVALFALGSVTYVATLPFSILGGNAGEAGKTLVVEPAKEVFVRCLGCTRPGRKEKVR
ncbi:MAG: hypothetical protein ACFHX7_14345 [Pseudomonadota bacterium]